MAKHELFNIPILRHLISYYAFSIDRQNPRASSIKIALQELTNGRIVVIFPEGSRNATDAPLYPKNGIGLIAALSKVKVVPALIEGTDKMLPKGAVIPIPAKIRLKFGNPIDVSKAGTDYERISHTIMNSIKNM